MRKSTIKFLAIVSLMAVMLAGCGKAATTNTSDATDTTISESTDSANDDTPESSNGAEDSTEESSEETKEAMEEGSESTEDSENATESKEEESDKPKESVAESTEATQESTEKEEIIVKEVSYEKYCTQALNVRDYPAKSGNKLHTFALNDKVTVVGECDNGWVQIKFNDGVAYVFGRYLSDEETVIKQEVTVTVQTTTTAEGDQNLEMAQQVFALVNQIRTENGVAELTWDDRLYESSKIRAEEASVNWSHTRPDGSSCFTVSDVMHGENLAKGYSTPEAVVDGWMSSQGHKDNILNASFTRTAIAYYHNGKEALWCHHFGY